MANTQRNGTSVWDSTEWTMDDIGQLKSVVAPHRLCVSLSNTTQDFELPVKLSTYMFASMKKSAALFRFAPLFGVFSPLIDAPDMIICVGIIDYRVSPPNLMVHQLFDGDGSYMFCLEMPFSVHIKNYDMIKLRIEIKNSNFLPGMIGAQLTIFFNIEYGNQNRNYDKLSIAAKKIPRLPATTLANFEILKEIIAVTVGKKRKVIESEKRARMINMFDRIDELNDSPDFIMRIDDDNNISTMNRQLQRRKTISSGNQSMVDTHTDSTRISGIVADMFNGHPLYNGGINQSSMPDGMTQVDPWKSAIINPRQSRLITTIEDEEERKGHREIEDTIVKDELNIVYPNRPRYVE